MRRIARRRQVRAKVLQPLQCSLAVVSGTRKAGASLTHELVLLRAPGGQKPERAPEHFWWGAGYDIGIKPNADIPSPSGSRIRYAPA
jgi:hypothetical protein